MRKASAARRSLRTGPSGPGNTVQEHPRHARHETATTYGAPNTGSAATNSVIGAHTVLVTIFASFTQDTKQRLMRDELHRQQRSHRPERRLNRHWQ